MSEITDALIAVLGPESGLLVVVLLTADIVQTRYVVREIEGVDDDLSDVQERVERVESYHMKTDGGACDD